MTARRVAGVLLCLAGAVILGSLVVPSIRLDVLALITAGAGCVWLGLMLVDGGDR